MKLKIRNLEGKEADTREVFLEMEKKKFSPALLHQVINKEELNRRIPRAHTKERAECRGGGRKPWRQKGTGRARHGSRRSPIWRGGGVTFGPRTERNYTAKLQQKMKRAALAQLLVSKIKDEEIYVLEKLPQVAGKTKEAEKILSPLSYRGKAVFLIADKETRWAYRRSAANISGTKVKDPAVVNAADLADYSLIVTDVSGWEILEQRLTKRN